MRAGHLIVAAALVLGQANKPQEASRVHLTMVAVCASHTTAADTQFQRGFAQQPSRKDALEPRLEPHRTALAGLPQFNSFRHIASKEADLQQGDEAKFHIDDRYTLYAVAEGCDTKGRARLRVRVEETIPPPAESPAASQPNAQAATPPAPTTRVALDTTSLVAPAKPLRLGGLKLAGGGELVVLLCVSSPVPEAASNPPDSRPAR